MVVYMKYIKYDDDNSYVDDIKEIIKDFDSYQFINDKLDIILKSIDKDIRYVSLNNDDDIGKLYIKLNGGFYGFNYDEKNFPLISFYTDLIIIHDLDTVVGFGNDNLLIDIFGIDIKNFEKI